MQLTEAIAALIQATKAEGRSPRTVEGYEKNLRYLLDFLGDQDVSDIDVTALRRYAIMLRERACRYADHPASNVLDGGLSPYSVANYLRSVRRLFKWLTEEGVIAQNPAARLKLPQMPAPEPKALSIADFKKLLRACTGDEPVPIRDRALLLFLLHTGCRVGALTHLCVADVDMQTCLAKLIEKGRKVHIVPFGPATRAALIRWLAVRPTGKGDWLFVNLGKRGCARLTEDAVGEVLRRLKQRAKVKGPVNPHAFRHGFAREWLRNGGDISVLARMLGHADPGTTMRSYAVFRAGELHKFHQRHSPVGRLRTIRV